MKVRKHVVPLAVLILALFLGSCASTKNIRYFKNINEYNPSQSAFLYDARIMPKDQLTISVSTIIPQASTPYNLSAGSSEGGGGGTYLVDNEGYINFPVVGPLKVVGLTKSEAEDLILSKIKPYMSADEKPIVTVRMSSYSITVIGEVGTSKMIRVDREKINIIEALAQAGDMGIHGVRNPIWLIREDATGRKEYHQLNMNDANIVSSPYYYLQQNDIVYVEPNKTKLRSVSVQSLGIWFSAFSMLTSVATFVIYLSKK